MAATDCDRVTALSGRKRVPRADERQRAQLRPKTRDLGVPAVSAAPPAVIQARMVRTQPHQDYPSVRDSKLLQAAAWTRAASRACSHVGLLVRARVAGYSNAVCRAARRSPGMGAQVAAADVRCAEGARQWLRRDGRLFGPLSFGRKLHTIATPPIKSPSRRSSVTGALQTKASDWSISLSGSAIMYRRVCFKTTSPKLTAGSAPPPR
jgi:hypothetical protein